MELCCTPERVLAAQERIRGLIRRTPVLSLEAAGAQAGARLYFKCENLQRAGAFKFRGASNALSRLSEEERRRGVLAFSSGNHAQAVALAARELGMKACIVMPTDAPESKLRATREYGAEVVLYDRLREDRESIARELAEQRGMILIPPYDHPEVIAGQGTAAAELFEETGPLDYLFVCVGGGGLIAGSALAAQHFSPDCKIIGVEPEAGNDGQRSFESGSIVRIEVPETLADGARTQSLGRLTFPIIRRHVHSFMSVSDRELCAQMRFFFEQMKLVVEPTGCLAAAGAMSGRFRLEGKRVGILISGGNVDKTLFTRCLT